MELRLHVGEMAYRVLQPPHSVSIPLNFQGPQPNTYGVPHATSLAFEGGGFVGDTRRGGSCNFETYTLTPHCNGTHTEGVGHIALDRIPVNAVLQESLIPATLITIEPVSGQQSGESYTPEFGEADLIISRKSLETALSECKAEFLAALLIRTLPNTEAKKSRNYSAEPSAFFSHEAMKFLAEKGIQHLLVDLPSVDRLFDEGKLSVHHLFWGIPQGSQEVESIPGKTITEFIFVPDEIPDGNYLLNLQIADFVADAAPSRPSLYSIEQV